MKGSSLLAQPSEDTNQLRFLAIDYGWMVRDGILPNTAETRRAFDHGYRVSDARNAKVAEFVGDVTDWYKFTGRGSTSHLSVTPTSMRFREEQKGD